jgi:hypothetical protein
LNPSHQGFSRLDLSAARKRACFASSDGAMIKGER